MSEISVSCRIRQAVGKVHYRSHGERALAAEGPGGILMLISQDRREPRRLLSVSGQPGVHGRKSLVEYYNGRRQSAFWWTTHDDRCDPMTGAAAHDQLPAPDYLIDRRHCTMIPSFIGAEGAESPAVITLQHIALDARKGFKMFDVEMPGAFRYQRI